MNLAKFAKSIKIIANPDVLICGIGCAGTAAAIGAARLDVKTMAVEQWPFAGGNITAASVPGCCGLADMTTGEIAVGGIALELLAMTGEIKLPLSSKKLFEPITDEKVYNKSSRKIPYLWDPEKFKIAADDMLIKHNVNVLYHTKLIDVVVSNDKIEYVLVANSDGVTAVNPKIVVDCTGDGNIAFWSGVPYEIDNYLQPATLEFLISNVRDTSNYDEIRDKCSLVLENAKKSGEIENYGGPWFNEIAPGILKFNTTRLSFNPTSTYELTQNEIKARHDAWIMYELWKKEIPEFKESRLIFSGPSIGIRESRRIAGKYTITEDDIVNCRHFPDVIVKGSWYIDQHPFDKSGYHPHKLVKAYDIPYRTLLPQKINNLVVAGRCHSATHGALASTRVGITAMGMGHAAGIAAAIAAKSNSAPDAINVETLQRELINQNAIL